MRWPWDKKIDAILFQQRSTGDEIRSAINDLSRMFTQQGNSIADIRIQAIASVESLAALSSLLSALASKVESMEATISKLRRVPSMAPAMSALERELGPELSKEVDWERLGIRPLEEK